MKKHCFLLLFTIAFFTKVSAQVGICKTALSLEDNSFVGSLWEPNGTVNYTEENGVGIYGLVIALNTSDEYLDIYEGHKVSIEYTDDTREVLEVEAAPTSYDNTIVSNSVINIYQRRVLVYPNYENLTQKQIKRIVIQRTNGKVWIINTTPKRAKRLPKEFAKAMQEALSSYKTKVSNNNYFNEDKVYGDDYFSEKETINKKEEEHLAFDETPDTISNSVQTVDFYQLISTIDWRSKEDDIVNKYSENIRKCAHLSDNQEKAMADFEFVGCYVGNHQSTAYIFVDSITRELRSIKFYLKKSDIDNLDPQELSKEMDDMLISLFGEPDRVSTVMKHFDRVWYTDKYLVKVLHMFYSASHNHSASQFYILTFEKNKSEGNDFRVAKWGESKESIMKKEGKADVANNKDIYLFSDFVAGKSCDVAYIFTNNKLSMAKYIFKPDHTNKNDYIKDYRELVSLLSEKYGETSYDAPEWHNTLYKDNYEDYGFAVSLGHLSYSAGWVGQTTDIMIVLYGENYNINLVVQYISKKFEQSMEKEQRNEKIKDL